MRDAGLPPGWREAKLGELGSFSRGRGGTKADEDPNGMPCIRYGDLYTHHDCIVRSFASSISLASASSYTRLQHGDVVFAGSGETFEEIGKAAAYCGDAPAYAGADTIIFRPGPDLLPHFAGYAVNCDIANAHKSRMGQGSSVIHIGSDHLAQMPFKLPPREQQQRIAEILSTVGEAIEQTEALIAKTQQIKAGLMRDLFTRGVAADGQLRPPRDEAPLLYQESSLGWIPKEWAIRPLRECLFENPTNGIYKPADQIGRGTLLVGQTAFTEERSVDFSLARRAVIGVDELRRYSLAQGNILLSRVFATLEGVGQPTLVPALPEPAVYESNMMRLRVDTSTIKPRLLFEWLRAHRARRLIVAGANASNQSSINQQVLNPLPVLVPQSHEQERMLSLIEGDDERAACERESLIKLRGVKIALMQDLLTGRVPVAVETKPKTGKVAANV